MSIVPVSPFGRIALQSNLLTVVADIAVMAFVPVSPFWEDSALIKFAHRVVADIAVMAFVPVFPFGRIAL